MSRDFWSRRKAAVEAEAAAEARAEAAVEAAERDAALEEKSDAEILAELELPDPDTLEEGDDFKVFLRDVVPARIRTRALRRLWRLNPVLANIDGLVDYGEDFTDSAMVVEGMQTAYQVGKGMTKHVEELARQAAEKAEAEAAVAAAPAEGAPEEGAESEEQGTDIAAETSEVVAAGPAQTADDWNATRQEPQTEADLNGDAGDTGPVEMMPRRMRFSFDGAQDEIRGTA
ncbi:DUF3306 domain-containing protein [Pseudophaeobacter sp. 1A16562]|uniref:DUF3306 domain-containing protein n=1 Tax=Pseudophaeobacter sp. 1A16562 TaxID=3098143 RepID=UPI0034D6423D